MNNLVDLFQGDHNVLIAKNGQQALSRSRGVPAPDLILLDILMPDMDGFEVCKRLKQDPDTAGIPIIFITALNEEEDQIRGFELGAVDFVTKPFMPSVVKARVKTHLSLKAAHARLEDQNTALMEAAQLKEDVDRIMRHDLKGPLSGIIGVPQLLLEWLALEPEHEKLLRSIEKSGYQMLRMINNSLDLYKMETGSYNFVPDTIDLARIVRKILQDAAKQISNLKLDVTIKFDGRPDVGDEVFLVTGEEMLCHSMLSNLIQNAIEASPKGETVYIHLQTSEVRVCRIHNQKAVPEKIRDRFFEKYVTSGKANGTGLGTYSAQLMARVMGGDITMQTNEDQGTFVDVSLPKAVLRD